MQLLVSQQRFLDYYYLTRQMQQLPFQQYFFLELLGVL